MSSGILAVLAAAPLFAQASLSAPSIGWVLDPSIQQMRPIWGLPGSASLGDPVDVGVPLASVVLSPAQDFGVAISGAGQVTLVRLQSTAANQAIDGVPNAPAMLAASPSLKSAVVWQKDQALLAVITGLPSAPASRQIDASSLTGDVTALAITDAGDMVAVATGPAGSAMVQVFVADSGAPLPIGSFQHVSALAFANGTDLLVADDAANTVAMLADVAGSATYRLLAANQDGINAPVALRATADGQTAMVANQAAHSVALIDIASATVRSVPCGCEPVRLDALSSPLLRLTDVSGAPLWILDPSGTSPRVFFVPAPVPSAPEAQQ